MGMTQVVAGSMVACGEIFFIIRTFPLGKPLAKLFSPPIMVSERLMPISIAHGDVLTSVHTDYGSQSWE
jgi:hypothetical protein